MATVASKPSGGDRSPENQAFEFFSFRSPPPMCAADDIFLAGKILPFVAPPPARSDDIFAWQEPPAISTGSHRLRRFLSGGGGGKAGYRLLSKTPDRDPESRPPQLRGQPPPPASPRRLRPRWCLCVLGTVRVPATMDMGDIRSRQRRQSANATAAGGGVGRVTWTLLRSLSCSGLESATAVTAPFSFAAHVKGA